MQRLLTTEKDNTNVLQDSILILQEFFSMNCNYGSYSIEEGSSSTCVLSYTLPNMITHQRPAMQALGFGLLRHSSEFFRAEEPPVQCIDLLYWQEVLREFLPASTKGQSAGAHTRIKCINKYMLVHISVI
jgi:hypothetical protein